MAAVVVLGYIAVRTFAASGNASLYLSPSSANYTNGQAVAIQVYTNTGGDPVNAVEADFSYPTSNMQFASIDGTGSAFDIDANSSGGNGQVKIARGHAGNVTGTALIATVHFNIAGTGSANLTFLNSSAVVRSTDNTNILTSTVGGNYTLNSSGGGGTPTPVPQTPTPVPAGVKTPTPKPGAATPTPATAAGGGTTPRPGGATPTVVVDHSPAPSGVPFVNKPKPLFGDAKVMNIVAIGIPALALLALFGLALSRMRGASVAGAHGSDQTFEPPKPQVTAPPPTDPGNSGKTFFPGGGSGGGTAEPAPSKPADVGITPTDPPATGDAPKGEGDSVHSGPGSVN